jgi:hypothetical protein
MHKVLTFRKRYSKYLSLCERSLSSCLNNALSAISASLPPSAHASQHLRSSVSTGKPSRQVKDRSSEISFLRYCKANVVELQNDGNNLQNDGNNLQNDGNNLQNDGINFRAVSSETETKSSSPSPKCAYSLNYNSIHV